MRFTVLSLFPEMILQASSHGLLGTAQKKNLVQIKVFDPRTQAKDAYKSVDDRPFGGGDGMVLQADPLLGALQEVQRAEPEARVIYLSPQGSKLDEEKVIGLMKHKSLILIAGRYGGIDQRFINQNVHEELSVGDYVLNGGELAALVVIEAVARKVEGVLGHTESAQKDSFVDGRLEAPHFTRPQEWRGQKVPQVLLDGNHQKIAEWRDLMSWTITKKKRPDLFASALNEFQRQRGGAQVERLLRRLEDFYTGLSEEDLMACGLGPLELGLFNDARK